MSIRPHELSKIGPDNPEVVIERVRRNYKDQLDRYAIHSPVADSICPQAEKDAVDEKLAEFAVEATQRLCDADNRVYHHVLTINRKCSIALSEIVDNFQQSEFELAENIPIPAPLADEITDLHSPNGPPTSAIFGAGFGERESEVLQNA
jgi:DNA-directed RNA polymerase beta' subunit